MSNESYAPSRRQRFPSASIIELGAIFLCVALFTLLAAFVLRAGPTDEWDMRLSAAVQSWRSPLLDAAMIVATYLCSWQVVVTGGILAGICLIRLRMWLALASLICSLVGNEVIVGGLKVLFPRLRPDQAHALLPATGSSFPSGHTFSAFALYGLLAVLLLGRGRPRTERLLVLLGTALFVALVGLSRVYVGAHWPSDVLGSAFLGSAWLGALALLLGTARRRTGAKDRLPSPATARRWAVGLVLCWAILIVSFAYLQSPRSPSAAIAYVEPQLAWAGPSYSSVSWPSDGCEVNGTDWLCP